MEIKNYHYNQGLTRQEYGTDRALLEGFNPVETDWKELLRWLMSDDKEMITKVWKNHVLTVLVEIVQKDLEAYKHSFAEGRGTKMQLGYLKDLQTKFDRWIERLEQDLLIRRRAGTTEKSPDMQATLLIKLYLEQAQPDKVSEPDTDESVKRAYYSMISAMKSICKDCDRYVEMIESDGYLDGALSLLLTYVRNYCIVVNAFNRRVDRLPDFYRKEILQVTPAAAIQDRTYLVVRPIEGAECFTLPENTAFLAGSKEDGSDLLYRITRKTTITPLVLEELNSVFISGNVLYKQPIEQEDKNTVTPLFVASRKASALSCGWMVESPMLMLEEGERIVDIRFALTRQSLPSATGLIADHFSVWISNAEGWSQLSDYSLNAYGGALSFGFTLREDAVAPVACMEDIHRISSRYPSIRITTTKTCPYELASKIRFTGVQIDVEVNGIRNFSFYNELGEVDTAQPFYPFGTQAGQGAWFMFGDEEMGLKPLKEACITGKWQKLPSNGYAELYKAYPYQPAITEDSFLIQTEYQENQKWVKGKDRENQPLFVKNATNVKDCMAILFNFQSSQLNANQYEYRRDRKGFFRVTLQEPAIGFGMDAYRELFIQTMIYNSRHKDKKQRDIPSEPIIPLLTDVVLSYKASDYLSFTDEENASIRLRRITPLSEYETFPLGNGDDKDRFLPDLEDRHLLYWRFSHVDGCKSIQVYVDLTLDNAHIPNYIEDMAAPVLSWEYLSADGWIELPPDAIVKEETDGFTQSGFIQINLPGIVHPGMDERFWIRTVFKGNISHCLAVRNVWLNCLLVVAEGGNGLSLPAGTIQEMLWPDTRVESIDQPLDGFGGKPVETLEETSVRQSYRISHRQRAVLMRDYEGLLLERFPEVESACCVPATDSHGTRTVHMLVFCRMEGSPYFITPAWKLTEMKRYLAAYTSPFVDLRVINPVYCPMDVGCTAFLKADDTDKKKVIRQLKYIITNYIAGWIRKKTLPELEPTFSCKGLHSRIANHEDIMRMTGISITFEGKTIEYQDKGEDVLIRMDNPWNIPVPGEFDIRLLPPAKGVGKGKIGKDFRIG